MTSFVLRDRLRELTGVELDELAGGVVEGELPLTEAVIDRLIQRSLPPNVPVTDAHVEVLDGNAFAVQLGLRGSRLLPSVRIAANIEQQPDLPRSPVLGLRWSLPALGPLAMLASPALAFFKAMPPWIRMDGDRVAINIGELLRERGLGELLPLLTRLRITTRRGVVVVAFSCRV